MENNIINNIINYRINQENEEELEDEGEPRPRFQRRLNAFELPETKFIKLFRLNKAIARQLINELREFMVEGTRSSALDIETRVLVTLRFLAVGEYQTGIGIGLFFAISQSSVSKAMIEVTDAINEIMDRWVNFPDDIREQVNIMRGFNDKFNFPGVLGCIDCTHVHIHTPSTGNPNYAEHNYVNRKGAHTLNVQLVCDSDMRIIHVNALFPGSTNDKFIWSQCNLKRYLEQRYEREPNMRCWLLGDMGYSLEPWMMTCDARAQPGTPEENFNTRQRVARCTVERCNGVLKERFRCILKDRVLHYHPERATKIINSCVVLHNMCLRYGIELQLDSDEEEVDPSSDEEEVQDQPPPRGGIRRNPVLVAGERVRRRLIQQHFT